MVAAARRPGDQRWYRPAREAHWHAVRMHSPVPLASAVLTLVVALPPSATVGQEGTVLDLDIRGSPLALDGSAAGIDVTVRLAEPRDLLLRVTDFDGRTVRELFEGRREAGALTRTWSGRDQDGTPVPHGPYRIEAIAWDADGQRSATDDGPERDEAWVTIADRKAYPQRPGFINVAVDPGHGRTLDGALGADGTREADLNLDIGVRLARMLEGAGVGVVLTRSSDTDVNEPPLDLTGDGVIDETDELAARPDLANLARADLFIAVHNNIAVNESVGGPSTFYFDERTFGDRSRRLARLIQAEMLAALDAIPTGGWQPYDHGALIYPYYVLRDYDPPRLLRPTQMPGVLSEGLFLSNPRELRLLKQPRVRQAMAAAYYEAIARYLSIRGSHVGYALLDGPSEASAGEPLTFEIEVRNQGTEPMRGWDLEVSAMLAAARYVGRPSRGETVGTRRIPRLEPGEAVAVAVDVTAPTPGAAWTLLFDALDPAGGRASRDGSPMLQVPLTTLEPPPPSVCCVDLVTTGAAG